MPGCVAGKQMLRVKVWHENGKAAYRRWFHCSEGATCGEGGLIDSREMTVKLASNAEMLIVRQFDLFSELYAAQTCYTAAFHQAATYALLEAWRGTSWRTTGRFRTEL